MGLGSALGAIGNFLTNRPGEKEQRQGLLGMAQGGQANFDRLGGQLNSEADYLRNVARGGESLSAQQLKAALATNNAQQMSMAAGAAPRNQAMAALNASRNAMQASTGLAGQQAMAGIAEREAAQRALLQALLQQRGQDQGAAQFGYGNMQPGQSWLDRFGGAVMGAGQLAYGAMGGGGAKAPQYRTGPQIGPNGQPIYVPPAPR